MARVGHVIQWTAAAPLWKAAADPGQPDVQARMQSPALLTFKTDQFIPELTGLLNQKEPDLSSRLARYESNRELLPGEVDDPTVAHKLKLYQPVHGWHHLVAASLVCRLPGLPDHQVDRKKNEKVGFVLRRLWETDAEMAWTTDETGTKGWRLLSDQEARFLSNGEEINAMFPMSYSAGGTRRRILAGNIPVASRDTFQSGSIVAKPSDDGPNIDVRMNVVDARIIAAYTRLKEDASVDDKIEQEGSRFVLLDLADFLNTNLNAFFTSLGTEPAPGALHDLWTLLGAATPNWRDAVKLAWDNRTAIHQGADVPGLHLNLHASTLDPTALRDALAAALDPATAPTEFPPAALQPIPKLEQLEKTTHFSNSYVIRCVYQRPHCGPLHADVVSSPSARFELASFFDFDAPARPIRIAMPFDTSVAGLRKFKKNVGVIFSDKLRKQMARISDKALKKNLEPDQSFALGEICMLSIPILTIAAMIALMIIISLLNIVFMWVPLLKICLPIPVKKVG